MSTTDQRQIRVFLSSTVVDFTEERELLTKQVFPALNRRARARGVEVIDVDLRWGVTEEQTRTGQTLPLCLGEIDRCRPYFIALLGERYGWVPPNDPAYYRPELLERQPWLKERMGGASLTELEILHGVLRNPEMAGYARFYLRDPAYAIAQHDPAWLAQGQQERQRLNALKQQVRASGFPVVEGLADPQAIVSQIEADLWSVIEERFPEQEPPDRLARDEQKHASYRQSRLGVYLDGSGQVQALDKLVVTGEQQILITGESGAGKSALIANWIEWHRQHHPGDFIHAHHLGCTNDANAIRPLLERLIETASRLLSKHKLIAEEPRIPTDWWELVSAVIKAFQELGRWSRQSGHRWVLVLDGLDRLDREDQQALPWLPAKLPSGVQVVASALNCGASDILTGRHYKTVVIKTLQREEQELLIASVLGRYSKKLDSRYKDQILNHPLAGSPLFLRVLLEEIRQCGHFDTLGQQLSFYLNVDSIDTLHERVLERLENDGHGDAVRKTMTALWASRAGLTETELLEFTQLTPLQWAPVDLALEKSIGRNKNQLIFDHDYLRNAIKTRYLPTVEAEKDAHGALAEWWGAREGWDERDAEEWPWQLQQASRLDDLRNLLLSPKLLAQLVEDRDSSEVINYWLAAKADGDGELDELIFDELLQEIEAQRHETKALIRFVDCIAGLFSEAGLYREPLLQLRTLSLELEEASDECNEENCLSSLFWLAMAHHDIGNYDNAVNLLTRCLEARERLLGPEHPNTLTTVGSLGLLYADKGDYEQAEAFYLRDLEASERVLGPEHPDTLTTVNNLGWLYKAKGDYEQAEAFYLRALEASERLLGPEHPNTLTTVGNLGVLYKAKGDYEQAEAFYLRDLEASERVLGPEHPSTLATVNNLGGLYKKKGNYEQAEAFYLRALEASERLLGPAHPNTLTTVGNLGGLYKAKGDYEQAEAFYLRALEASEQVLGSEHPSTLVTVGNLGGLYEAKGDYEQAEAFYLRALEVSKRVRGPEHPHTLTNVGNLGGLYEAKGDYEQAEAFYLRALEGRERVLGCRHSSTNQLRYQLAELLSIQGRYREAIDLRRAELKYCTQKNGETDPGSLVSINQLAIDLRESGALEDAENLFRKLVVSSQKALDPGDFQISRALGGLAQTLEKGSRLEEALAYRQQAFEHRLEHEGSDAWWTNQGRLDLARVLHKIGRHSEARSFLQELHLIISGNEVSSVDELKLIQDASDLLKNVEDALA